MKIFLVWLLLVSQIFGASLQWRITHLSQAQYAVLIKTYYGALPYDLALTMSAIVWLESDFGERLEGPTDDWGHFQVTIKTFKGMYGNLGLTDGELRELLKNDYELNLVAAIAVIHHFQKVYGDDWLAVYGGYNGGYKGSPEYAEKILKRVRIIKIFMRRTG